MLLYYLFWMFMGFILHFYIIFDTNLLTQSPVPVPVFSLVSVFRRKGISNGVETEWNLLEKLFSEGKQPERLGIHVKKATRKARGRGARPPPLGAPSTLVGPSWLPWRISSAYIYPYTLKPSATRRVKEICPRGNNKVIIYFLISW